MQEIDKYDVKYKDTDLLKILNIYWKILKF